MLRTTNLVPMAHLICVAHTRLELAEILVDLRKAGVENLMALGGDPPTDPEAGVGELAHASELVELARAIGGFSIGVAAQPSGHPLSSDLATDRDHLAAKLALADFAVTQFFFEAHEYTSLVADLAERGVTKPVLPGIMPVERLSSVPGMARMGAAVPAWMVGAPRGGRRPGRGRGGAAARASPAPPSCASSCWTPVCRACTSTRSTGRRRPVRSTPPWASARTDPGSVVRRPTVLRAPGACHRSPRRRTSRCTGGVR